MRRAIKQSIRLFSECFDPPGPVLEIGSLHLPGQEELCNLRSLFPSREFIGCDIRQGTGVDRIEDAQALSFADGTVGTVLMFEVLEHLPDPWKAVSEAHRVLRPGGLLAVSAPFSFRLHGFPTDYWRFTAGGIDMLLAAFADRVVFSLGPRLKPAFVFGVALKGFDGKFAANKSRYQGAIEGVFASTRSRGRTSVFKERARDFFGFLLGRANLSVAFFDPNMDGGYRAASQTPGYEHPTEA